MCYIIAALYSFICVTLCIACTYFITHAYSQMICGSRHDHTFQSHDINKSLQTVIKYTVTITEHDGGVD